MTLLNLHAMTDTELTESRTVITVGIEDRRKRRLARFGRSWAPLDFTDLDKLDHIANEQLAEIANEQDRRHRVKTGATVLCVAIREGLITPQRASEIVRDEPGLDERSRAELLNAFGAPERNQ